MSQRVANYADLLFLKEQEVAENLTLEYKSENYHLKDPKAKNEMLKDICAFANTQGGQILIGIKEKEWEITGIIMPQNDQDALKRNIIQLTNERIEPRVSLSIDFIKLEGQEEERFVLVITVPSSLNAPHLVISKDGEKSHQKFYIRHISRNDEMSLDELRDKFMMMNSIRDKINAFIEGRNNEISHGEFPCPLKAGPLLILQLIPLSAFSSNAEYSIRELRKAASDKLIPLGAPHDICGLKPFTNLDGIVSYWQESNNQPAKGYVQLYRTGIIEDVSNCYAAATDKVIKIDKSRLLTFLYYHLSLLKKLQIPFPILLSFSVVKIKGLHLTILFQQKEFFTLEPYQKDRVKLSEEILEEPIGIDNPYLAEMLDRTIEKLNNAWGVDEELLASDLWRSIHLSGWWEQVRSTDLTGS